MRPRLKLNHEIFASIGDPWLTEKDRDGYFTEEVQELSRGTPEVGDKKSPREFAPRKVIIRDGNPEIDRWTKAEFKGSDSRLAVVKAPKSTPTSRERSSDFKRLSKIASVHSFIRKLK